MNQNDPMTPTPLSPAAQAVLDAFLNTPGEEPMPGWNYGRDLAAVLRAAADQVVPENANAVGDEHDDARYDQWVRIRYKILAIAAELEGSL
jgi:hypothetical protein